MKNLWNQPTIKLVGEIFAGFVKMSFGVSVAPQIIGPEIAFKYIVLTL